jgi:DNA-binding MarR family transcriptional regulator
MAELVRHLEEHGYVVRVPDPGDRRAKLVVPTDRGRDVVALAQGLVPQMEARVAEVLGADRVATLRSDLQAIRRAFTPGSGTYTTSSSANAASSSPESPSSP